MLRYKMVRLKKHTQYPLVHITLSWILLKLILGTTNLRICRLMTSSAGMKAASDMMVGLKYAVAQTQTGMKRFFTLTVRLLLAHR